MGLSPDHVSSFLELYGEMREDGCYNKITGKKISACLPMHTFGFPIHLQKMINVCEKWKIPIVEDSAESLGSLYKGLPTGSFGKVGIFSFNGNKIITSGGGGALVTNNKKIADRAKHLTTTAKIPHNYEYFHDDLGYNFRMPNLNAALALAQLENLDKFLKNKRKLATVYNNFFLKSNLNFRYKLKNTNPNYWLMCLELENFDERNYFLKYTNENKIMTRPIWTLLFRLPMYKNFFRDDQLNAIKLESKIVNIPSSFFRND